MVEESAKSVSPRVMERSVILGTGSVRVPCLLLLSQSVLHERVAVLEQTMVLEEKDSEIANHHPLHGVRAARKDRKMVQDPRDENSKNAHLSSGLLLLLSKTTNGVPRCDQTPQLPSHLYHLETAVKHLRLLLCQGPCQLGDPN
jgi:hypothetical protein